MYVCIYRFVFLFFLHVQNKIYKKLKIKLTLCLKCKQTTTKQVLYLKKSTQQLHSLVYPVYHQMPEMFSNSFVGILCSHHHLQLLLFF